MGTYLRWWSRGKPQDKLPVKAKAESEAKDLIPQMYPQAIFRWKPANGPELGAGQHICAWTDEQSFHAGEDPIADIISG